MGMNNMGMNNMGMNNMGMNMGMNNMGMNMGMNNMGMNNMGMNNMDMNNMAMFMGMNNMTNIMNEMNKRFAEQNGQNTQNDSQNNDQNEQNQNQITLTFIKNNPNAEKKQTSIQCLATDKLSDVIEKYRSKTGDQEKNLKFIHNAKKLNPDLLVSECGLLNNSIIFVIPTEGIIGGRQ